MTWSADGPQGYEAQKVKYDIVPYTRGRGLDLGCGALKTYAHFIGVDNLKDVALFGVQMKPDLVVETCENLDMFATGSMDFVFSSHLLEHIENYRDALREWWRVVKVGGHLVLYLPHKRLYPNIGQPGSNPDHKHDFMPGDIINAMLGPPRMAWAGWDLLVNEDRSEENEYSFLQVYRKRGDHDITHPYTLPKKQKTACVVRYGGFGDQIQASGILPALKADGYRITMMTTPGGKDILKADPHIDDWFLQDKDQVPNGELGAFWEVWAKKFDKFVNLSESVEGTLLAIPGRANHAWPQRIRHQELNKNYGEWTAAIAGVPYQNAASFYPTKEETDWAASFCVENGLEGHPLFVWCLAGSSIHKYYPHQDVVLAKIMVECPEARVVMTGDMACKILEAGWENEPRIIKTSGEISIRKSLTLASIADVVIGPETGVLNAVAFRPNRKVVMLSHSSAENLTKHWTNTVSLAPSDRDVPCYPCHRLHYTSKYCWTDKESGAAMCQVLIDPEKVFEAIKDVYEEDMARSREEAA